MSSTPSRIQLPKIRKILPKNFVDIKCILNPVSKNNSYLLTLTKKLTSNKKHRDTKYSLNKGGKSHQQSPNAIPSSRGYDVNKSIQSSSRQFIPSIATIYFDHNLVETQKNYEQSDNNLRFFNNALDETSLSHGKFSNSFVFKKGMSGFNISKLYKSRNQIKNKAKFSQNIENMFDT